MRISAGIIFVYNTGLKNKILLCHPTNSAWIGTFGPPKGGMDIGETPLKAAIRETEEEIGISVSRNMISNINNPIEINYTNKRGFLYKKVIFYIVKISNLEEVGMEGEIVPRTQLQLKEIDFAAFLTKKEAKKVIFGRFKEILDLYKNDKKV